MARKARVWFPGASYHIICRGNHKNTIFMGRNDLLEYLRILKAAQEKYAYYLHSYCLMTNHVHLQIETVDINIGQIMKKINMEYAIYFNGKYQLVGHLFQDRFRAQLIEGDAYNLEVSRYIHMNPVRASIVHDPIDYEWSSYREYMGIRDNSLLTTTGILNYFFNNDPIKARASYKNFVEFSE